MTTFVIDSKWDGYGSDEEWINLSKSVSGCSVMTPESLEYSSLSDNSPLGWPGARTPPRSPVRMNQMSRRHHDDELNVEEALELEMMKDKFSKLLLGEDMSGGGKGVCTALAVSNAITNLYAAVFGQFKRLEPLSAEKKSMWKRETDCLLSICDYIVDNTPSSKTLSDGTIEVTLSQPRPDICMNLPALRKLDNMILEILESFHATEFWYTEKGNTQSADDLGHNQRNEEKWWLPVPCVPKCGLSEKWRKLLQQKRESANQMHKAARAINAGILSEMEVPDSYLETLPKSGRAGVGDAAYRYMCTTEPFSPDYFLDCLEIKSGHEALDVADRIESSMCIWKRKASFGKNSWMGGTDDKNETLASRAETIMLCLKQRYPELSQTTLDTCKIQYNSDVGQAILESYSRVLESLAYNLASRIEDVIYADTSVKSLKE